MGAPQKNIRFQNVALLRRPCAVHGDNRWRNQEDFPGCGKFAEELCYEEYAGCMPGISKGGETFENPAYADDQVQDLAVQPDDQLSKNGDRASARSPPEGKASHLLTAMIIPRL
jgi:hypothetical protein